MYLGNKVNIIDWKEKYKDDMDTQVQIDEYLKHHNVAIKIQKFQKTTSIELSDIRKEFPKFLIPQMYYYLYSLTLLDYLEEQLKPISEPITHSFEDIKSNQICVH